MSSQSLGSLSSQAGAVDLLLDIGPIDWLPLNSL